ncbi:hypothetical protein LRS74_21940 [Streptomyces sp. LX-29]|nr:hypothetical protein [Streptomyces sp. LX-29]WFB09406.1 hypothetical protein LRS74_21940 [Streptomyces sp. LX-29]
MTRRPGAAVACGAVIWQLGGPGATVDRGPVVWRRGGLAAGPAPRP